MKDNGHNENKNEWKIVFTALKPKRLQIAIIAACTAIIYITSFTFPLTLQRGIDAALAEDSNKFYLMVSLSIGASLTEVIFSNWRLITITNIGTCLELLLCGRLMKTILSRAYSQKQLSPGNILNATNRISYVKEFALHTAPQTILEVGQAIISFVIIIHFSPIIAFTTAVIIALSVLTLKNRSSNLSRQLNEYNIKESRKQNAVSSIASSLKNIKHHALESFLYKRTLRHIKNATMSLRMLLLTSGTIQFWGSLTSRSLTLVILITGSIAMASKDLTIGEFLIIQLLASRLSTLLSGSSDFLTKYQEAKTALEKIRLLNELPAEQNPFPPNQKRELYKIFSLHNLTSRHSNNNVGLEDISLDLYSPGFIVFTGVSGSGKSTLAQTLIGLYGFSSGDIYYHGNTVSAQNLRSLRKEIGVTSQDNYIFSGTLKDNLCCGQTISNFTIMYVLNQVGLTSFVESIPDKLEYFIDENGKELSGGQKQKICLARALLRNSNCYILDEPTSALDCESSAVITNTLIKLSKTKLLICITHDPKLMKKSDKIFLIKNGSISTSGHHTELMTSCSEYKKIFSIAQNIF